VPAGIPWLALGQTVYRPPHSPARWSRAAVGILDRTLRLAAAEAAVRRVTGRRLAARLPSRAQCGQKAPGGSDPGYLRVPALARSLDERRSLVASGARLGVAEGYPHALTDLPALRPAVGNPGARLPGARTLAERLCTLPTHGRLTGRDILALEQWIDQQL
jgi:hypothetical protein